MEYMHVYNRYLDTIVSSRELVAAISSIKLMDIYIYNNISMLILQPRYHAASIANGVKYFQGNRII